jgi:hypothetical protein
MTVFVTYAARYRIGPTVGAANQTPEQRAIDRQHLTCSGGQRAAAAGQPLKGRGRRSFV